MPADFLSRLRKIKQASEDRAAASAEVHRSAEQDRAAIRAKYYELREPLVDKIDGALDDFCREFDGFQKQAAYMGDEYCMSVSYDELVLGGSGMDRYLSQLTFKIKSLGESSYFVVGAKTVLRNKECGQRNWDEKIEEAQAGPILEFAQNEVLRFAEAYGARANAS